MKVLKFGGTSVGSIESIQNVKKIAEARKEPIIIVVSALGGITDQLLKTARMAVAGDSAYLQEIETIVNRHYNVIEGVVLTDKKVETRKKVNELLDELTNIYKGVYLIRDLSAKTNDMIVSYGERMSSVIVSNAIAGAKLYDSREFIKTDTQFGKHNCNFGLTNKLVKETFTELPQITLIPGFIATDSVTGEITNLGRGGSDYTAAIVAAALQAEMLEIWTDVDGFLTADPRIISNAYVIDKLSFVEAMELCNFGAKVIFPPTIYPVYHKNIPIIIKNTFNPDAPGTFISRNMVGDKKKAIKGISSINDACLITVQGLGMVGVIGVNFRIFRALAKSGISVFLVSQAASENNTSFGVRNADADLAVKVLKEEFEHEISIGEINDIKAEKDLACVAIVGENMKHTPGIAGKLFGTLGRNGINVIACAQGASETNISFVIRLDSLRKALNVIHESFFLSDYQELNLFVAGVGLVGGNLLQQIQKQQEKLLKEKSLKINVVGLINSKHCLFKREGINLENYKEELATATAPATPESIISGILEMNIFNSVFVDCTASETIASVYNDLLKHNVSVVCANKVAASSSYENYTELKQTANLRGVKFLFETNVGAGLPIINTMNALTNSGDRILKLEAVLSGTLNFIFNTLSEEIPLSKTIVMAKEAGFAEPDPRIDLSGKDVIRKLVILSREAGYPIEQEDVKKNLFIPQKYFDGSLEDFWNNVSELDGEFEERRKALVADNKRYRFVAKLEKGEASVGLQEVDDSHPFFHLEGSNNIIMITTERYNEYPMIIKGYGAGASVTAAGVFADIISIANIR
ncbi:bifunctional aspartate kinase/homoserine dehydrogenase I [Parabacteroides sp. FAFU027]|uniref:bifunctional aspartate kinase/homoserine dehydrogenase I n=1 Tax=Parabacteroides sp. FAFU027 TaxID=2922715 RepID=UPI001FAFE618|nr:bifunctional aspartate kinase/homoserine dehydrogenase I [Parabacteroides sp. FAFU027]